jgi:hypothetical protein
MKKINYELKLKAIRPFTNLGINSRKHFSRQEKWYISYYYNKLLETRFIEKDGSKFVQKVKFQKNKKSNVKGAPKLKGKFIKGASPQDKVNSKGHIIKNHKIKIFIPLDFSDILEKVEYEEDIQAYVEKEVRAALNPYWKNLKEKDFFTIALIGGAEFGQNKRSITPKLKRRDGIEYATGIGKKRKLFEISAQIAKLLTRSINKYKISENLIEGIYLWKFKNQRQKLKRKEKSVISKAKKNA